MRYMLATAMLAMLAAGVPASAAARIGSAGQTPETGTHTFYGKGRCAGSSWILKSVAEPADPRVKTIKTDTDGDGVVDRIESWAVTTSHVLKDRSDRRDGWVARGTHSLLLWDFDLGRWGEIVVLGHWPVKFVLTCKHVRR